MTIQIKVENQYFSMGLILTIESVNEIHSVFDHSKKAFESVDELPG